jgi:hypothetical protein
MREACRINPGIILVYALNMTAATLQFRNNEQAGLSMLALCGY